MARHPFLYLFHLLFAGIFFLVTPCPGQQHRFRHINTEQGLSSNTVYVVFKDKTGFMWFCTSMGICRFDGNNIVKFTSDPYDSTSLSGNFLYAEPFEDREGYIWIGTHDNGVSRYDPVTEKFKQFTHDSLDYSSLDNNSVWSVYQDLAGTIWVGTYTGLNRFDAATETFQVFRPEPRNRNDSANLIYSFLDDPDRGLWITTGKGVFIFDREIEQFAPFQPESSLLTELNNQLIFKVIRDSDDIFWFCAEKGLFKYDPGSKDFQRFSSDENSEIPLSGAMMYHILQDPLERDILWVTSFWGLNRLNKKTGHVHWILNDPGDPFSIGSNEINWTYIDETGLLWVATENAGVAVADLFYEKRKSSFTHVLIPPLSPDTIGYSAVSFAIEKNDNTWVGTSGGGLYQYDDQGHLQSICLGDKADPGKLKNEFISTLFFDAQDNFLIGTWNKGLFVFQREANVLKKVSFKTDTSYFRDLTIHSVIQDDSGRLWVATCKGLYYSLDNISGSFHLNSVDHEILKSANILTLCLDEDGRLWIGSEGQGLFCLELQEKEKWNIRAYHHDPNSPESISNNLVLCAFQDSAGKMWFGTDRGLNRYSPDDDVFITISFPWDPGCNFIYSIQEDKNRKLWLATEAGLVMFDPSGILGVNYKIFRLNDGIPFEKIHNGPIFRSSDGNIFVGSKSEYGNGFFYFNPDSLLMDTCPPPIVINDFKVRNETFNLDSSIIFKKTIVLQHNENFFSFEFSALDFYDPLKNNYAYKMEGVDNDWIYSGNRRFANYTDIKPGRYRFLVKGSNSDNFWNDEITSIRVVILPPWWKTWWAYLGYTIILSFLIFLWRMYDLRRIRLKQQLELEQVEAEKLKELDSMKSRFFANVSHEFRTPLTLILGFIEKIKLQLSSEGKKDLEVMQRNALRLQSLINQLLDISKLESGKMTLKADEVNLVYLVNGYIQSFESLASQKEIDLVFESDNNNIPVYMDREKLEKILYNLLSNAFKFTPAGGKVAVTVVSYKSLDFSNSTNDQRLKTNDFLAKSAIISVSDTGPGISPTHLPHIFDRFYQADDSDTRLQEGSGIGLALVKELVELHHGKIMVESRVGKGTTFLILLPLGNAHLKEYELKGKVKNGIKGDEGNLAPESWHLKPGNISSETLTSIVSPAIKSDLPMLLIVEDNSDLRTYIRSYLETNYQLIEAEDGEKGLNEAIENIPDLILSDVMMPKISGMELCTKIKSDERTCHIPVILLTARASLDDRLEGLETGADDFITKPFDPQELLARIKNLVEQRRMLRELFNREMDSLDTSPVFDLPKSGLSQIDKKFMTKAIGCVDQHLSDPEFSVEQFAREMAVSHMQLHRKLKALTGYSSSLFIRIIRLNRAAKLFKEGKGNVTEVAFEVGFNNLSFFAKCFNEQFGVLPSEYIKSAR